MQTGPLLYLGRISNFYYGFLGAVLTVAVGYGVSLLFAPPPPSKIKGLTRRDLPEVPAAAPAALPATQSV
jgi:hypothetical protein